MIRSAANKALGVGRATVWPVVVAIMLVVAFGAAPASAHTGYKGLFHLGHKNVSGAVSTLVGKVATGSALVVKNPSGGSALGLQVNAGQAPLTVNAAAGTATNLNADKLDGQEASSFARAIHAHAGEDITSGTVEADRIEDGSGSNLNADQLDNLNSTDFAAAAHNHDERYFTETESDGRYLFKGQKAADSDKLDGQDSSAFAPTSHNHDGRYYSSGSKVADSDKLDGKDSSVFGVRTDHATRLADYCDTANVWNECAPVTVTVPDGKNYIVSVWSSFSAKDSGGAGASQDIQYCSAGKGPSISTTNPCVTPFGASSFVTLHDYLVAASSSGETVSLSPGTYTFFTAIKPTREFALSPGRVITKVMVRDATNGL